LEELKSKGVYQQWAEYINSSILPHHVLEEKAKQGASGETATPEQVDAAASDVQNAQSSLFWINSINNNEYFWHELSCNPV